MNDLNRVIEFFAQQQIPMLPCYGLRSGVCTCYRGERCPSPGKHPLMSNWQAVATFDAVKVKSWFASSKPVNLAIATGRKGRDGRHLIALDGDVQDHPFIESLKSYGVTVMQRSGSGGSHALYWSKSPVKNSCQLLDEKLDVRGLGGILIIAPSTHKSGKKYEFLCDLQASEIQACPLFLEEKLQASPRVAKKAAKSASSSSKAGKSDRQILSKEWQTRSIPEIRQWLLDENNLIPNGIRNVTMHRLLSSDRAKGATKYQLESSALNYLPNFQDPLSFLEEIEGIIDSVLRYQPYNTSHERVNEIYIKWLKRRGIEEECPLEMLNQIDMEFFDSIDPRGGETTLLSLKEIGDHRAMLFLSKGYTKFSVYKTQLLAKKLTECGAVRRRSAKKNLWEVSKRILEVEDKVPSTYPCAKDKLMTDKTKNNKVKDGDIIEKDGQKLRVEVVTRTAPVAIHSKEHLFQGRIGLEYNMASIRRRASLTDEQKEADDNETLVTDREALSALIDSLLPGDIVGFKINTYRVTSKEKGTLLLMPVQKVQIKNKVGQFEDIGTDLEIVVPTDYEIDKFRSMGFFQILWRNEKPYGEESTQNINLIFLHPVND